MLTHWSYVFLALTHRYCISLWPSNLPDTQPWWMFGHSDADCWQSITPDQTAQTYRIAADSWMFSGKSGQFIQCRVNCLISYVFSVKPSKRSVWKMCLYMYICVALYLLVNKLLSYPIISYSTTTSIGTIIVDEQRTKHYHADFVLRNRCSALLTLKIGQCYLGFLRWRRQLNFSTVEDND